ncbi:hypothetical protein ACFE04_022135 [Oxalis oulophora]
MLTVLPVRTVSLVKCFTFRLGKCTTVCLVLVAEQEISVCVTTYMFYNLTFTLQSGWEVVEQAGEAMIKDTASMGGKMHRVFAGQRSFGQPDNVYRLLRDWVGR